MSERHLSRRTILRGVGTAMALPLLDAMLPNSAGAAVAQKKAPLRMGFLFVPNGVHMPDWRPGEAGPLGELPATLKPLEPFKDALTVFTGLTADKARPNGDGAGDHARSASAFLTGAQPRKTSGADIKLGISVDQYAAQQVGRNTRFPSLEIGCERGAQAGNCDSGYSCAYSSNISWRSENTPVAKEVDPRQVFDRLFGGGNTAELEENRGKRDRYNKSILDFVLEDAKQLQTKLGVKDQQKLDEYFTSVREIEQRVELAGKLSSGNNMSAGARPTGIPQEYGDHLKLMVDMLVLAWQADLTRISTFMFANEGSNRSYKQIGVPEGHHDLSHHGGDAGKHAKLKLINHFHIEQVAYLLSKLKSIKEGDKTMLDNVMLVYGSGISDGNAHNHDDLPILMLGKAAGTIKTGRHLTYPRNTPLNNLWLSMLDRMAVPCHSLGDSTGRLKDLA
jgi:hypothetical protein